ncbi:glycosyltransferase [archaeon]|nr:glycosyltransferase [archaeon]
MKLKKILFLSPLPPPHYGSAASSQMCLKILKDSKKFKIQNIKLNYSKEMSDIGKINLDKIKGIFYVKKQIKKQTQNFKPDLIYFVPATYSLGLIRDWLFVREIKRYWKGQILFHIRSRILNKTWNSFFGKRILKNMYTGNRAIILGKELIRDLREMIQKKDIFILPNAIKNEISNKNIKEIIKKRKENKQFNILFLSNMDRRKGWPKLLDTCKILDKKNFNFKCDFVGGWWNKEDKEYFEKFIKKNKLEKKVFAHGKKLGKEWLKFLDNANVLIYPTERDTFGRVLIEAYMYGVPVIANKEGSIPSIVEHGKTGFLLKKNTPKEIASIVLRKTNWEQLGKNARILFLREFVFHKYKTNFLKLFK